MQNLSRNTQTSELSIIKEKLNSYKIVLLNDIDTISEVVQKISFGHFDYDIPKLSLDEMDTVKIAIHDMALKLNEDEKQIKKSMDEISFKNNELEVQREQTNLFLESTEEGILGFDLQGNCTFSNSSALKMLGYKDKLDVINRKFEDIIYPVGRTSFIMENKELYIDNVCESGKKLHLEEELFCPQNGNPIPVECNIYPMFHRDKISGAVCYFKDISKRLNAERITRKLSKAVEFSPASIVITDKNAVIEYVNPKVLEITGYKEIYGVIFPVKKSGMEFLLIKQKPAGNIMKKPGLLLL